MYGTRHVTVGTVHGEDIDREITVYERGAEGDEDV